MFRRSLNFEKHHVFYLYDYKIHKWEHEIILFTYDFLEKYNGM